jgi:hypothetical protein
MGFIVGIKNLWYLIINVSCGSFTATEVLVLDNMSWIDMNDVLDRQE